MRPRIVLATSILILTAGLLLILRARVELSTTSVSSGGENVVARSSSDELADPSRPDARKPVVGSANSARWPDPSGQDPRAAQDVAATAHLRVHVTREDTGAVGAGAWVYVQSTNPLSYQTLPPAQADERGLALLDIPPDSYCDVEAWLEPRTGTSFTKRDASPLGRARARPVRVGDTEDLDVLIEFVRDIAYFARLVDDDTQAPIAGASVLCGGPPLVTDATGAFSTAFRRRGTDGLPSIWVKTAGYCSLMHTPGADHETAGTADLIFMHRNATVTGVVLDAEDAPRRAALVGIVFDAERAGLFELRPGSAWTGDDGRFVLNEIPADVPVMIDASPGAGSETFTLRAGESRDLVLRTRVAVELTGNVLDPKGALVRGGTIHIEVPGTSDTVHVRSDGSYYIPFVYAGKGFIDVESDEEYADVPGWARIEIEIPPGHAEWKIDLPLQPLGPISGRVMDSTGNPVREGFVLAHRASGEDLRVGIATNGSFVVDEARAGVWFLRGSSADSSVEGPVVEVRAGTSGVELTLPATGSMRGRITDPTGLTIESPVVTIFRVGEEDNGADADPDGSYVVPLVPEGSWYVRGMSDGFVSPLANVVVNAGKETRVPDLALEAAGTLRVMAGHVRGATVEVRRATDLFVLQALESGDRTLLVVPLGDVVVIARDPKRGEERHEVHVVQGAETILSVLRTP